MRTERPLFPHSISSICKGWTWRCQRPETTPGSCNRFPWPCPYRPNDQRSEHVSLQMDVADVAQEAQEHLMPYFSTQHKYLRYLAIVFQIFWPWGNCQCNDSIDEMWWNARQQLSVLYPTRRRCLREHADISTNRHEGRGTHRDVEVLDMLRHSESRGFDIQIDRARNTKAHEAAWSSKLAKSCQILAKFLPNSCQVSPHCFTTRMKVILGCKH